MFILGWFCVQNEDRQKSDEDTGKTRTGLLLGCAVEPVSGVAGGGRVCKRNLFTAPITYWKMFHLLSINCFKTCELGIPTLLNDTPLLTPDTAVKVESLPFAFQSYFS
jgi:hypothetical protein